MSLEESQNLLYQMCFAQDFDFSEKTLQKCVSPDTAQFLQSQDPKRLKTYRRLVHGSLKDIIRTAFKTSIHFLGDETFNNWFEQFLPHYQARSNYFRHVPYDFYDFIQKEELIRNHELPFLADFFQYDFYTYDLIFKDDLTDLPKSNTDIEIENSKIFLNPNLHIGHFDYAVHEITTKTNLNDIKKQTTYLLIYREVNSYKRKDFTLNSLTYELLHSFLHQKLSLGDTFNYLKARHIELDASQLIQDALAFLKELMDKQVVLALI
jgi:hypothetical protein